MDYSRTDSSWFSGGAAAAAAVALTIIRGFQRHYAISGAYAEQSLRRFMMRMPTNRRQLMTFIEYANRMAFDTSAARGSYCPMCGYRVIARVETTPTGTRLYICPMCNEVMSAEDALHRMMVVKKEFLNGQSPCR